MLGHHPLATGSVVAKAAAVDQGCRPRVRTCTKVIGAAPEPLARPHHFRPHGLRAVKRIHGAGVGRSSGCFSARAPSDDDAGVSNLSAQDAPTSPCAPGSQSHKRRGGAALVVATPSKNSW